MERAEGFIAQFHALTGTTTYEKQKSLYKLFNSSEYDSETLDKISTSLAPKTYLEELFKVEFLIFFRRAAELYDILLLGNEVFVAKILKQHWFLEQIFVGNEPKDFLPKLSYAVRVKVLKKLSKLGGFDRVFDAVLERYGIKFAARFVTSCETAKIREVFTKYSVKFDTKQLKELYCKEPSLLEEYFVEHEKHTGKKLDVSDFKTLIGFILKRDLAKFEELRQSYRYYVKIGRRLTKKLMALMKEDIIKDPHLYEDHMKLNALFRKLSADDRKTLLGNYLPSEPLRLDFSDIDTVLKWHSKKNYNFSFLENALEDRYGKVVSVYKPMTHSEDFLRFIPQELREELVDELIVSGHEEYVIYLNTSQSIPKIKQKVNLISDVSERKNLILRLERTCAFNKDWDALLELLMYVSRRHLNETFLYEFLEAIRRDFDLRQLTEEMWMHVNKLIKALELNGKAADEEYKIAYLEFLFIQENEKVDELVLSLIKDYRYFYYIFTSNGNRRLQKHVLLFTLEQAKDIFPDKDDLKNFNCDLIAMMEQFNEKNDEERICFLDYPELVEAFKVTATELGLTPCLRRLFKSFLFDMNNADREFYLKTYWDNLDHYLDSKDWEWFLKFDPNSLANYSEEFIAAAWKNHRLWYKTKKYSHLSDECLAYAKSNINTSDEYKMKKKLVKAFSTFSTSSSYREFAQLYIPEAKKLDFENTKSVETYELQCHLAQYFKNIGDYQESLPILLQFCAGDYFGSALHSLSSILYRIPEENLKRVLEQLSKSAVSVRKHALFFALELCDQASAYQILSEFSKNEPNITIQKRVFLTTLRCFASNPTDDCFEMLQANMERIDPNDDETLESISQVANIPRKYRVKYVLFVWTFLEKKLVADDHLGKLNGIKGDVLSFCFDITRELPVQFHLDVIQKHFAADDVRELNSYVYGLLTQHPERMQILKVVLEIFANTEQIGLDFFDYFCSEFLRGENETCWDMLRKYCEFWEAKIDPVDRFDLYIKMFFLKLSMQVPKGETGQFADRIHDFVREIVEKYGQSCVETIADVMVTFMAGFETSFEATAGSRFHYYEDLLKKYWYCVPVCLLVLRLIPSGEWHCYQELRGVILKLIAQQPSLEVKIKFNMMFRGYRS